MPMCVRFTNRSTGEVVTLMQLDDIICEAFGDVPDAKTMHWFYDGICLLGFAILIRHGDGSTVLTAEMFDAYKAEFADRFEDWTLAREFLIERYKFEAWFSR